MKLKFKQQAYQTDAVKAVVDCFAGQPESTGFKYAIDPGRGAASGQQSFEDVMGRGFANERLGISRSQLLENLQGVQRRQNLPISTELKATPVCDINLDTEMETGTGKTYCYIKTMFELNRDYGWSKFIVVVPSIAIREGVSKSFEIMAEHFLEQYGKRARYFIYNSKALHNLESFSSDAGINVMIINVQAFNAQKNLAKNVSDEARRIFSELDDWASRRCWTASSNKRSCNCSHRRSTRNLAPTATAFARCAARITQCVRRRATWKRGAAVWRTST
jgi:type III restriction enzyme